jgi:enamine deaminase RidA (YjgF/YER057c/UK114 family)
VTGGGPDARLEELGIELPAAPAPAASYLPFRAGGGLLFTAGQIPLEDGELRRPGRCGAELTTEAGAGAARAAAINLLAVARAAADGDLSRVRLVKVTVFVASTPDFTEQHLVANGASELLADVLGEDGRHARSAVGVPSLPLGSPVEVEAVYELRAG